jgi:hypothetical protein
LASVGVLTPTDAKKSLSRDIAAIILPLGEEWEYYSR